MADQEVSNKLLPTDSIDLLINAGAPMMYSVGGQQITAPAIHINGLRNEYSYIRQSGDIHIVGVSFSPYGLYPFVHTAMSKTKDAIVDFHELNNKLAVEFERAVREDEASAERIERILLSYFACDSTTAEKAAWIESFLNAEEPESVQSFCVRRGLQVKTFERLCLRFTGYSPTTLRRLHRFQATSNQIVHEDPASLADVAYGNSYADQAHLIRDFKSFAGETPRSFVQKKQSVKENARYKYR